MLKTVRLVDSHTSAWLVRSAFRQHAPENPYNLIHGHGHKRSALYVAAPEQYMCQLC